MHAFTMHNLFSNFLNLREKSINVCARSLYLPRKYFARSIGIRSLYSGQNVRTSPVKAYTPGKEFFLPTEL